MCLEFQTSAPLHLREAMDTSSRQYTYITIQLCKNALNDFKVSGVVIAAACLCCVVWQPEASQLMSLLRTTS